MDDKGIRCALEKIGQISNNINKMILINKKSKYCQEIQKQYKSVSLVWKYKQN